MSTADAQQPATEPQLKYLEDLTAPVRLARLTGAEARYLIAWLRGPPRNMSRKQQLYLAGLLANLSQWQVHEVVEHLRAMCADAPTSAEPGQS